MFPRVWEVKSRSYMSVKGSVLLVDMVWYEHYRLIVRIFLIFTQEWLLVDDESARVLVLVRRMKVEVRFCSAPAAIHLGSALRINFPANNDVLLALVSITSLA